MEKGKKHPAGFKSFLAGGCGGVSLVFAGHPLDTIKVRLQTQPLPKPGQIPQFEGLVDCAKKTIRNEGIRGLYKGMGTPLLFATPMCAVGFWSYGLARRFQLSRESRSLSNFQILKAGVFSGIFVALLNAPGERIKCLLQVQRNADVSTAKFKGPLHCFVEIYRESGLTKGVYRGLGFTMLRDLPASGVYFVTYECFMRNLGVEDRSGKRSPWKIVIAGGCAGIFANIVGLPSDVLKSRYQTAPTDRYKKGLIDVAIRTLREEGVKTFFKGAAPVMTRAFPANAACFLGYEGAMKLLEMFF